MHRKWDVIWNVQKTIEKIQRIEQNKVTNKTSNILSDTDQNRISNQTAGKIEHKRAESKKQETE